MKKITILDPADFAGGAELSVVDLVKALAEKADFTILETGKISRKFPKNVQKKVFFFPKLRPFRLFLFLKTLFRLRAFLRKNPPEILHSNSVRAGFFCAFSGVKKWTHFAHDFTTPRFLATIFCRAKIIFACSEAVKNDLISKKIPAKKIKVVFNGVEIPQNFPQKKRNFRQKIAILGRIDPWKGHELFLKVAEKMPENDFLIFGAAEKKFEKYEKKLRKTSGKNVFFEGFQNPKTIFKKIDATLHLSQKKEPFGRVILESLAHQIPVFAMENEIFSGKILKTFSLSQKNPAEIAAKIRDFFRDKNLQKDFKKAAKTEAEKFEKKKWAEKIWKIWKNL